MKNDTCTTSTTAMPKRTKEEIDRLIRENIPLVWWVVNRFAPSRLSETELEEVYSAGLIGLWDAVEKFDPSLNYRFSTFAVSRIRGRISGWVTTRNRKKRKLDREAISLSLPLHAGDKPGSTLEDFIVDERAAFEDRIIAGMEADRLLERCTERERRIIRSLGDGLTLQEVGELENGVSRERVFQIKERATRKIKGSVY